MAPSTSGWPKTENVNRKDPIENGYVGFKVGPEKKSNYVKLCDLIFRWGKFSCLGNLHLRKPNFVISDLMTPCRTV